MSALKAAGIGLLTLLLIFGLTIGVWAFRVATADTKGRGDQEIAINSATNRTGAQERFEDLYQEVLSADRRIDVMAATNDGGQVAQTNLAGAIAYCIDVVADYNAQARKVSQAEFRAYDLPAQIDNTNPATDCQETTR